MWTCAALRWGLLGDGGVVLVLFWDTRGLLLALPRRPWTGKPNREACGTTSQHMNIQKGQKGYERVAGVSDYYFKRYLELILMVIWYKNYSKVTCEAVNKGKVLNAKGSYFAWVIMKSVHSSRWMLATKPLITESLHLSVSRAETSVQRSARFFTSFPFFPVKCLQRLGIGIAVRFVPESSNVHVPCVSPK